MTHPPIQVGTPVSPKRASDVCAASEKQKRYRARKVAQGQCPHCGKPSFPYYECEDRRRYKRVHVILRKLVKAGVMERRIDGRYLTITPYPPELRSHRIEPGDCRYH